MRDLDRRLVRGLPLATLLQRRVLLVLREQLLSDGSVIRMTSVALIGNFANFSNA